MFNLHLVSSSIDLQFVEQILAQSQSNQFLFIGDGVIWLLLNQTLLAASHRKSMSALACDTKCRGIDAALSVEFNQIDDSAMILLCVQANKIVSW